MVDEVLRTLKIKVEHLEEQISEIYNKSEEWFGSNKIFEKLKTQGIVCSFVNISSFFLRALKLEQSHS